MRLNPFNPGNINVGTTGGGGGMGRAGGLGCGTIILAALGYFVFGLDPMQTAATIEGVQGSRQVASAPANEDVQAICTSNPYATETCNALSSLNDTWAPIFAQQNAAFRPPTLRFATAQQFNTACGPASTGMGPFYCPGDETIYIDTAFYDELARMAGNAGDFARYYVIAHEYGHHIQTITGIAQQIRSAQQAYPRRANELQVLMELQADCYAGVWAGRNRNLLEPGDIEEGLMAASAIGDDTLQRQAGRRVNPETFTHGTSQQRMQALRLGLGGDDRQCDRITALG
ncbi:zinc metalloprotease [Erythrobacteraceae bacterium CFH 75059]|uniref:KPN_02809 family neutral zinc metallopeptidase n=1 Tax=Qipengyuania thermophila TaxID=2509361 RepID=UPI00101FF281|nr:neutral zinc metallopeptidase [Qipengyuania thermophila]TCD05348.1 zinc metalloprotease [Erythrobacteraceae bacterium CFH 75059]